MNFIPENVRLKKRIGFGLGAMSAFAEESIFLRFQADYFISQNFTLEFNSLFAPEGGLSLSFGSKYFFYPNRTYNFKPYAGLAVGIIDDEFNFQIPVGINYVSKKGFDFRLGLSGAYIPKYNETEIYGELITGFRF